MYRCVLTAIMFRMRECVCGCGGGGESVSRTPACIPIIRHGAYKLSTVQQYPVRRLKPSTTGSVSTADRHRGSQGTK